MSVRFRNFKILASILVISVMVGGFVGCVSKPYPKKNYYNLVLNEEEAPPLKKNRQQTLLVGPVIAVAGLETRSLVYHVAPNQYENDFYNEFVAPPSRLLADHITQYLDKMSPNLRSVKNTAAVSPAFRLECYIASFDGDYTQTPPLASVSLKFILSDMRPEAPKVLLNKTYTYTSKVKPGDSADLVKGLNSCTNKIMADMNKDLIRLIK